jgi:16S rRNA (adenine1518-N6/adenine1519-N6)-dimethyltransferase
VKHLRPRKGLGQSFLTHEPTADAIVEALECGPGDTVLEIGPGKGVLTRRLLQRCGRVIAVELDPRLAAGLQLELGSERLTVVQADFLKFDLAPYRDVKVIGNLPYNVSSQMVLKLLDERASWKSGVFTTQREFALRVLAEPGSRDYGALSVYFARACGRERLFNIEPAAFKPRPDVVSTVFRLSVFDRPLFEVVDEARFRSVVRACFAQRRKTIANSLLTLGGLSRADATAALERAGINPGNRAETLAPVQFKMLVDELDRAASSS